MTLFKPRPDRRGERDHEEQIRERHRDLGHAGDDRVDPAAEEAGDRAEEQPEEHRDERRADADLERDLGAVEEPQELVAAGGAVGAEDVELALDRAVVLEVVDPRPRPDRQEVVGDAATGPGDRVDVVRPVAEQVLGDRRAGEGDDEEEDDEDARLRARACPA